jgi:hypothetical protein
LMAVAVYLLSKYARKGPSDEPIVNPV